MTARLAPQVYVTSTGYDGLNRATQLILPAEPGNAERRPVLLPSYNRAGALAQVSLDGEVLIRQLAYNARGQRLLLARGNGLMTRYTYDQVMFRLQRLRTEGYAQQGLTLTPQSGTTRQDTLYTYDLSGNITATRERAAQSGVGGTDELVRGFSYDALYRLLSATGRENQPTAARPWQQSTRSDGVASTTAYTQRYEYDELGNIQQLRHVASNSANSFTRSFDYGSGATNYLQAVQLGAATVAYQYDAAGNVTQENGSRHYQWDAADQLRQFATWTGAGSAPTLLAYYLYAGGQRVKKLTQTSADTWQVTVYADGVFEHRYEVRGSSRTGEQTQVAVLDGQHRLYQRRTGDALGDQRPADLYALEDYLGSATAQTNASGALVSREEYYPFGETSFGSHQKQRYRFCGKELDEESGLYYYGMRYYAPWLCRFVSVDPLAAKYPYYTPYQYAGNRPINFIDLDGAEPAQPGGGSSGSQGATNTSSLGKPSQATRQDATHHSPPARKAAVHSIKESPFPKYYISQGRSADEQRRYNNAAKVDASIRANNENSPLLGGGEPGNQMGLARTLGTASVEVPKALAIEAAGVYAFSYLGTLARLGSKAGGVAETAIELVPTVRRASAASGEYASWGAEFSSEGRMVEAVSTPASSTTAGEIGATETRALTSRAGTQRAAAIVSTARSSASRILGREMVKAGTSRPANVAAHHIVAFDDPRAQIARQLLQNEGIGLNEAVNGVFLPKNLSFAAPP